MGCEAYAGNFPKRDNAAVTALRQAGAVIFGKTVTAEIGGSHPGPTTNPWNAAHTPGGSSSGSAAAVAAGYMPAAIGTQVGGSIIRPAAYCGNLALKPTQGAINRGERMATSMSTHGPHANCVEDLWAVAIEIASRAGGDRGCIGLQGPRTTPAPVKPQRLVVMEGEGWSGIDAASIGAFEAVLDQLRAAGVEVLRRGEHATVARFEEGISQARRITGAITGWENHWNTRNLVENNPGKVSERAMQALLAAEKMTPEDYYLLMAQRDEAQLRHQALAPLADAVISLSCPGPAPVWSGDKPGQPLAPRPTGDSVMNTPSSMLFAPVVTLPLIAVGGMPVGVQLLGQQQQDARMVAMGRWMLGNIRPVAV
jgi:Asp-tRNA(Asn)/Glu-tRNA(Gln) amidotransferase A subunit family amidase